MAVARIFVSAHGAFAFLLSLSIFASPADAEAPGYLAYPQVFLNHSAVMLMIDPDTGQILDANHAAAAFYGYKRSQLTNMAIEDINQFTTDQVAAEREAARIEERNFFIFRHKLADGDVRTVEVFSKPVAYGTQTVLMSIITDVTPSSFSGAALDAYRQQLETAVEAKTNELKTARNWQYAAMVTALLSLVALVIGLMALLHSRTRAHKILKTLQKRHLEILRGTNVGTWEWNVQTGSVQFNERWAEIVGYSLDELRPVSIKTWMGLAHPEDLQRSGEKLDRVFRGETEYYDCEARMRHKDGHWVWVLDRGCVVEWDKNGQPVRMAGTHTDISVMKSAEAKIRQLAMTDPLTGLSNRAHFTEVLDEILKDRRSEKKAFALLMVDLDRFKPVNDTYGHAVGDEVLKSVASILRNSVRQHDVATRLGGDEFAIIISDYAQRQDIEAAALRIRNQVRQPHQVNALEISIDASVGIALYPEDGSDATALLKSADESMYQTKRSRAAVPPPELTWRVSSIQNFDAAQKKYYKPSS